MPKNKVEPKISAAVGVSSVSGTPGLAKLIEGAMSAAASEAQREGITDPVKIKERMMAARQRVKDEIAKAATAESEKIVSMTKGSK